MNDKTGKRAIAAIRLDREGEPYTSLDDQRSFAEDIAEEEGLTLIGTVEGHSDEEIDAQLERRKDEYDEIIHVGNMEVEIPEDEDDDDEIEILDGAGRPITNLRQYETWVVSQAIRNELEMFHGGGAVDPSNPDSGRGFITDKQMKALNIVIRRTVHNALGHLNADPEDDPDAMRFAWFQLKTVHDYMEPPGSPELEEAYKAYAGR